MSAIPIFRGLPADVSLSPSRKGKLPYRPSGAMPSKLMIEGTLAQRVRIPTKLDGAPKKAGKHWKRSDTILSGSRPQTLLYGPRRGRWADQGEWSEGRTSEEEGPEEGPATRVHVLS